MNEPQIITIDNFKRLAICNLLLRYSEVFLIGNKFLLQSLRIVLIELLIKFIFDVELSKEEFQGKL